MDYGLPTTLYTAEDLLQGYDPNAPQGFAQSWDFKTYRMYVADGAATPRNLDIRRAQADHDAHMAEALKRFLDQTPKPKLVGVMGGHSLGRTDASYAAVARLGRHLTQKNYLVVTGGGPGAMEAAHLGACFADATHEALDRALAIVGKVPALPALNDLIDKDGGIVPGRDADLVKARLWMNAALDAKATAPKSQRPSLAIPTWLYGNEPTIPFASHYAKYFQNSIREETLISQSRAGIVYAQGGGGTVREIFEDAEQNYYAPTAADFTPMIFFDPDRFWQTDAVYGADGSVQRKGIRLDETMTRLFTFARWRQQDAAACLGKIRFTTDHDEIDSVLRAHAPLAQQNLTFSLAAEPLNVTATLFDRATA